MGAFFTKKVSLGEQLKGSIDIHNHILPGIDDGAENEEAAIELIKKYREWGISRFIATPHVMNDYYPNTPETIKNAQEKLISSLWIKGFKEVEIKCAAEYMMDQPFIEKLQDEELLCLSENYILVEMSYFQAPINLNEILFKIQTKSYKPLLAHPERYMYLHQKKLTPYEELKERGCSFQLNLLSLTGHYGKGIKEIALRLLNNDMIDFVGSDTHQMRHLDKLFSTKIPKSVAKKLEPIVENTSKTFQKAFIY